MIFVRQLPVSLRFALICFGLAAGGELAEAQTTVTKKPTGQISQTITDWSSAPTSADIGEFGSGTQATETLVGPVSLAGITFTNALGANTTFVTANGSILTLGAAGITVAADSKNIVINHGLTLAASQAWNIGSGRVLEVGGVIDDAAGGLGFTKSGAGRVTLSGSASNTFTGLTTITGGVLFLNKSGGATAIAGNISASGNPANIELGAANQIADTSVITLAAGAKLQLNGFNETVGGIQTPGSSISLVQATESGSNAVSTLTVNNAADHVFDGILRNSSSGTGNVLSLVKTGTGTLTLMHSGTHATGLSHTGTTTVDQGVLELRATGNGRTLTTWQSPLVINAGGTLRLNHNQSATSPVAETLSRTLSGTGSVVKTGAGQVNLNAASSFSGVITLEAGTLNAATFSNYGSNSSLGNRAADTAGDVGLLFTGGTLQYSGATAQSTNRAFRMSTAGAVINASGSAVAGTLSFIGTDSPDLHLGTGARVLTLTGTNTGANAFNLPLYDQDVSTGKTGLNKSGTGTWMITQTANTYSGVTTLTAGILNVASLANYGLDSSLGNRTAAMEGASNVSLLFRGGTLQYTGSTPQSTNRAIRVSTTGGAFIDASGSTPSATLSFTATSSPDLYENAGARQVTLTGTNTGDNIFSIRLTDQSFATGKTSLNKTGPGKWVISVPSGANSNSYSGPTTISNGTLAVQGGGAIADGGVVTLADVAGAVFQLNAAETIGTLDGGGTTGGTVQLQTFALTLGGSHSGGTSVGGSFAGRIASAATNKMSSLIKTGSSTIYLTGTDSSYAGFTELNGGILNIASIGNLGENSSIGNRAAENAGSDVGLIFRGGTLQYTGSTPQSTNRAIRVSTTGGAFIDASGSTPEATLKFTRATSPDFFESSGNRQITFTGTNTGDNTFAMAINQTGGTTTVNKIGPGTWVLTGGGNYTGPTLVSEGTLLVNGNLPNTAITVAPGAVFGGSGGTITGTLQVNGSLSPGASAALVGNGIGVLRTGSATFGSTSSNNVFGVSGNGYLASVLNANGTVNTAYLTTLGNRASNANDRLEVNGTLDLGSNDGVNVSLVWASGYLPQYGHAFDILDWTTLAALTNFNYGNTGRTGGSSEDASFDLDLPSLAGTGWFYNLDHFATSGVIIVVPEPGRACLLLVAAGAALVSRRRRLI